MQIRTLVVALCLLATNTLHGQSKYAGRTENSTPTERFLKSPNYSEGTQLIPVGTDLYNGNENNTIHYGRTPANSSGKPVLIFVHGYASNAQVFFTGNDNMYADVYRDGYRSVYVSLTPNENMWTNGAMLAIMISRIKAHYNNAPIVMIGWSKGGVDIDAALVHYGARNDVSEVFTLSSPHFGTGIAEIANNVLLSLVNVIFMQNNNATLSLQRGYMNYFRSITDGNSNNSVPYTTIGGWGNGPLNRLDIPQNLLHALGGPKSSGGNDGVVPYVSSKRPGGKELFSGLKRYSGFLGIPYYNGPDETNLDHFEVTRGGKVWPFIKNELTNAGKRYAPLENLSIQNPNKRIASRMQWITSAGSDHFIIGTKNTEANIILLSATPQTLVLVNDQGKPASFQPESLAKSNANETYYRLQGLKPGRYRLGNEDAIAILTENEGPEMILDFGDRQVLRTHEDGSLDFVLTIDTPLRNISVEAYIVPVSDLSLNRLAPRKIALGARYDNGQYTFKSGEKPASGVYQLMIEAKGTDFRRNLLTSFAISEETTENGEVAAIEEWTLYPNPAGDLANVRLDGATGRRVLTVYSIKGEKIRQQVIEEGTTIAKIPLVDYQSGLYIIEIESDGKKSQKMLIRK
ncbi:MAG: T9SS type A sorting domain-containing protein [Cyclobacteriaceae bacterium]